MDFKKGLINLIETNRQINMNSNHSVSSYNIFKSHLNAKSSNTVTDVRSSVTLLQCLLQGWCERTKMMWIQLQEKNWKEPPSSTISTEASFNGASNEETYNVNKTLLAITENKLDIKYIQMLPGPIESTTENVWRRSLLLRNLLNAYLILQFPISSASLPLSPSLSSFALSNWNSYSTQS